MFGFIFSLTKSFTHPNIPSHCRSRAFWNLSRHIVVPGKCWESCYISALNKHSPFTFLFAVPLLQWKAAQASMLYTVTGLPMLLCCFRDGDDICPPGTSGELNSLFLQAQTTRQGSSLFRDHLESWALSL